VTEVDVPKTTVGESADDVSGAASAHGCPVGHGADGSTPAESAAPRPPAAIPATALPVVRMRTVVQMLKFWKSPTTFMTQCREQYGNRFAISIRIPPRPVYVLTESEDLKAMFLAPPDVLHTGNGSVTIEKYTGQSGLAWLDEDDHKKRRRLLMPSMHGKALERIGASVTDLAVRDVATWPRSEIMALHPHLQRYAFNAIREVIFGSVGPSCWDELADVLIGMSQFNDHLGSVMQIHKMPPAMVRLLRAIRSNGLDKFLKLRQRADALLAEAIEERRKLGELGDDMLSVLFGITHEDGSPLTNMEVRDEMMTIFIAGTSTTAAAIAWAFEYLSCEPAACDRLVAEIDEGTDDAYLTATVNEVLRLRPPLPQIIPREVMKPIEVGGVRYEPGAVLWGSAHLMNRDPVLYADPNAFRPERFLDVKPSAYTWIPFGGGRIRCLGDGIAILNMKAVIRAVLSTCELGPVDRQPEEPRSHIVVIMPSKGARLELRPRSREPKMAMD
jgi:cytochrome P450 family 110